MTRRVAFLAALALVAVVLGGCGVHLLGRAEAWRGDAEAACWADRPFRRDDAVTPLRRINDAGACGIERPLEITALADGAIRIGPAATLGCPAAVAVERWLSESVQPSAIARLGSPVVAIRQISSYACRSRNSVPGAEISEHAFGNALDVAGFELADGRVVMVAAGWRGTSAERAFLREVHAGACEIFTTVLGPGADNNHHDHFHLDLARHNSNGTARHCEPTPVVPPSAHVAEAAPTQPPARPQRGNASPVSDIGGLIRALAR